jgi:hypothetical protein
MGKGRRAGRAGRVDPVGHDVRRHQQEFISGAYIRAGRLLTIMDIDRTFSDEEKAVCVCAITTDLFWKSLYKKVFAYPL